MARGISGTGGRVQQTTARVQGKPGPRADGAEIDSFDESGRVALKEYGDQTDRVTIGSAEYLNGDGQLGARVSVLDAQTTVAGDRVTLSGTGPSAEGQAIYSKADNGDFQAGLGASVGLAGVAANTQVGGERNNLGVTVGFGLGAGFEVGKSKTHNEDGSVTRSLNLEAKLLGRFGLQGSWTVPPSAGPKGRNLRGQQLAQRRLAQQALNQ